MTELLTTIFDSLRELLASGIKSVPAILTAIIILLLTRYLSEFVRTLATKIARQSVSSKSLQLLIAKIANITAWIVGILFAAVVAFPGLRLGDIVATLGLSSVAIGFAFQDIFKNFLAGILILLQEPFRMGDQIIVGDFEGTVERIDVRTTKIRTYQGERVLLPNSEVFTSAVQVQTAFDYRRTDLAVGVDYNTSLSEATTILERTINNVEGVNPSFAPEIDLVSFGDSSLDFLVRYWTRSQQKEVRITKTRAILAIKQALDEANISIPYPIRTLYFYNQDGYSDYLPKPRDREYRPV